MDFIALQTLVQNVLLSDVELRRFRDVKVLLHHSVDGDCRLRKRFKILCTVVSVKQNKQVSTLDVAFIEGSLPEGRICLCNA